MVRFMLLVGVQDKEPFTHLARPFSTFEDAKHTIGNMPLVVEALGMIQETMPGTFGGINKMFDMLGLGMELIEVK